MTLERFMELTDTLLGENGCAWCKEQTHESMRQYILEESYEVVEAINNNDMDSLKEELGDLLSLVVFQAKTAEKAGKFSMSDVIDGIANKLVSRHSHVFGGDSAESAEDVVKVWEDNKAKERKETPVESMKAVPKALPALVRAEKVISRSKMELPGSEEQLERIEISLKNICSGSNNVTLNEEYGKLLLEITRLGAILDINAEFSLTNAVEAFINTVSPDNSALGGSI